MLKFVLLALIVGSSILGVFYVRPGTDDRLQQSEVIFLDQKKPNIQDDVIYRLVPLKE